MTKIMARKPALFAISTLALGLSLGLTPLVLTTNASAAELEKCYGIAKAGQDDGSKEMEVPGMSTVDFQGGAFKYVTKGTCEEISTPFGPGSLKPLENRPPRGK